MKVILNGKIRTDIIKIHIANYMIDFETKSDSFFFYFSDLNKIEIEIVSEDLQ